MGETLHFLGDSHLRPARYAAERGWFDPWECRFTEVGGATAVGLRHPTSKTQALLAYRQELLPFRANTIPIFQLGEVDCGFVIWVRSQRYGETVAMQFEQSLGAYGVFLREIRDAGHANLIVTSATLPTLRDGQLDGEVAHLRREVRATMRERTDLTMRYNQRLAAFCAQEHMMFVDFTPDLVDPATGLLADRLRHPDPADHHLAPEAGGRIWSSRILEAIRRSGVPPLRAL